MNHAPDRGRVLRVKTGYNPNSSSVGSNVPEFLFFALGSGFLVAFALNLLDAVNKRVCPPCDAPDKGQGKDDE